MVARAAAHRERSRDGAREVEEADSLSIAFLLVLERLPPVEHAVFLLHEVFAVQAVRSVINPKKLGHLGPLADVRALLGGRGAAR